MIWQPIETAPKDGTWILVYGERYSDDDRPPVDTTRWIVEIKERWEYIDSKTQKLVANDDSHWDYEQGISPTHWMPIPPKP